MQWTVQQVARSLGVTPPSGLDPLARLAGVSIDSRTVGRGQLFFAIHGPRHDGHAFIAAALAAGAGAAVAAESRLGEFPPEVRGKIFGVRDTLAALQQLAREIRRAWGKPIAAVAGSVGKTTTKEILAALVAARYRVLKTEGNLNNEYGLPLTLARLDAGHEAAVVELGMSHAGELRALTQIAEPQIGVVTRVAVEHLEFFVNVEEIAAAERELIEALPGRDTTAVLNADDDRVSQFARFAPGRVMTFGVVKPADFRASEIEDRGAKGSAFTLIAPSGSKRVELSLAGRHNVANAAAAFAAASQLGVTLDDAARVLPRLKPAAMRGEVLYFEDGLTVINDCYNSSPSAMSTMMDLLAATPASGRRILAAGEMLELGTSSAELHREVGREAAKHHFDLFIAVRGDAQHFLEGAASAGYPKSQTHLAADSTSAAEFIVKFAAAGDVILVKGSRGVRMERIVEALRAKHDPHAVLATASGAKTESH